MEWKEDRAHRLANFASLLYAGCNLPIWCFSADGRLYFTTSIYAKELGAFLDIGGCKEYALTQGVKLEKPFVMSDVMGLIWVGEFANVNDNIGRVLILLGPMFNSETSYKTIEERMRERDISLPMRSIGRKILLNVPVLTIPMMNQYIKMLHFSATETMIQTDEIIFQSQLPDDPFLAAIKEPPQEKHFMDYEKSFAREKLILQCVREGNLHYEELLGKDTLQSIPDNYMTGDPLREAKDTVIIFIAQCCRAAVDGKLSIKAAKEIEIHAIRRLEACQKLTDISNLRRDILAEYIRRVHALNIAPGVSQPIVACCDYVKAHFMEPIDLADIAKSVGYTEYYLTRKFQKELGIRLLDYIRNVRLEYAKIWLINTENSIQEISEILQFGTRNYFSRVFKEMEGITPLEYREQARVIEKSQ